MRTRPSVILIREWEGQLSGSGCCGRVEGDFLTREGEPVFRERRACMEAMAPLSRTLRERFGDAIELQVVDPRNAFLIFLLLRDFWAFRGSSPELCVKVRGSSSMLLLGCLGDLLRFEKREIQVATFAPDRSSP